MKRRLILVAAAGLSATLVAVVAVLASTGSARAQRTRVDSKTAAGSSATSDPLQTITSYQLQWMHLFLGRAPATSAVSAAQADQAVEAHGVADNGGPILETVLATCSMTPQPTSEPVAWANRPCWVVSLKPGESELFGPADTTVQTQPSTVQMTVEYALVDAHTGEVFDEAAGTPPAQAP
jgi:hypothetical protein